MDIDKMFKLPALPVGSGSKRKMGDAPSEDVLKRFRPNEQETSVSDVAAAPPKVRTVTVEDEEENGTPHQEADPEPDNDDDDEGRFFGGGLNDEQNILDIFDQANEVDQDTAMTAPALRRFLGRFERVVAKNAEQRGKYPDDPTKFIDSEADLDGMVKQFLPLTQNPPLYYPEIVNNGTVSLMANLLSHENTDIAIDVVEVLHELTDEDVGVEADINSDGEDEADEETATQTRLALAQLIDELLSHSIFELLVSNLRRLNEEEDTDRQGVFHILGVFENLLSFMPPLVEQVGSSTTLLQWLVARMEQQPYDTNKQYASELLSILLQGSRQNALQVAERKGVDTLLTILSQYRNSDPRDGEEQEFMENAFNCLCSLLAQPECKKLFVEGEGVELMTIMMKERLLARNRAIKVLDYAFQTDAGTEACEQFVEVLGLKTLFSAFMGKGEKKKHRHVATTFEDDEHILGVLVSLFTNLASDTPPRIRLVAKFVEGEYEKVDRLLELREMAETKLRPTERQIASERQIMVTSGEEVDEIQEDEWYLRRLDAGLSALQAADYIIAFICMEDDGVQAHTQTLLARKGLTLEAVKTVLEEMAVHVAVDVEDPEADPAAAQQHAILEGLATYLGGPA